MVSSCGDAVGMIAFPSEIIGNVAHPCPVDPISWEMVNGLDSLAKRVAILEAKSPGRWGSAMAGGRPAIEDFSMYILGKTTKP